MSKQKSNVEKQEVLARQIWLAGLGAYARGYQGIADISSKGRTWFDELTQRGLELESKTKNRVSDVSSKASTKIEAKLPRISPGESQQLDAIDSKLDKLVAALEQQPSLKAVSHDDEKPATQPRRPRKAKKVTD